MDTMILEVTQVNQYVRDTLNHDPLLRNIRLRGEVTNFAPRGRGHWYFSLKDDQSVIDAVMYQSDTIRMSFVPKNGMRIIVNGSVTLWAEGGRYQIRINAMRPDGAGTLYQQFLETKEKLAKEGIFSRKKRSLPARPRRIAVVTSAQGAIVHDVCRIARERDPGVQIVILPVPVQGAYAAEQIANAIVHIEEMDNIDVVIVGRGGGSLQDLWAFNEECLVRSVANCKVPVISAVGHETDITLCDLASDLRASTPSNAAELAVPTCEEIIDSIQTLRIRLDNAIDRIVSEKNYQINTLKQEILSQSIDARLMGLRMQIRENRNCLVVNMQKRLGEIGQEFEHYRIRMNSIMEREMISSRYALQSQSTKLKAMNPLSILERGYAIIQDEHSTVIATAEKAAEHRSLNIRFADGLIHVVNPERNE